MSQHRSYGPDFPPYKILQVFKLQSFRSRLTLLPPLHVTRRYQEKSTKKGNFFFPVNRMMVQESCAGRPSVQLAASWDKSKTNRPLAASTFAKQKLTLDIFADSLFAERGSNTTISQPVRPMMPHVVHEAWPKEHDSHHHQPAEMHGTAPFGS